MNDDLRDSFRARFPDATWALVDASDALAGERISQRDGHFTRPAAGAGRRCGFAPVGFLTTAAGRDAAVGGGTFRCCRS